MGTSYLQGLADVQEASRFSYSVDRIATKIFTREMGPDMNASVSGLLPGEEDDGAYEVQDLHFEHFFRGLGLDLNVNVQGLLLGEEGKGAYINLNLHLENFYPRNGTEQERKYTRAASV